jgi:hypothetical protein
MITRVTRARFLICSQRYLNARYASRCFIADLHAEWAAQGSRLHNFPYRFAKNCGIKTTCSRTDAWSQPIVITAVVVLPSSLLQVEQSVSFRHGLVSAMRTRNTARRRGGNRSREAHSRTMVRVTALMTPLTKATTARNCDATVCILYSHNASRSPLMRVDCIQRAPVQSCTFSTAITRQAPTRGCLQGRKDLSVPQNRRENSDLVFLLDALTALMCIERLTRIVTKRTFARTTANNHGERNGVDTT